MDNNGGNEKILKLNPIFKHVLWGGNKLRTSFGYNEEGEDIGECWAISAHKNGDCTIANGTFAGKKLSEVWNENYYLFGRDDESVKRGDVFPLLTKIIDAKEDLSIQVHPDNEYAYANENGALGKMECWYIIDCDDDTKIVIGHNCKNKEELKNCINNDRYDELIREIPVKKGDFFQIDPGTVHAIKGGTLILETQQSSDITYRLYDYNRLQNGKLRELHKQQCIDVIKVPDNKKMGIHTTNDEFVKKLVTTEFYNVWKISLKNESSGNIKLSNEKPYLLCSVIKGEISVFDKSMKKGDHFIITNGNCNNINIEGKGELIISSI